MKKRVFGILILMLVLVQGSLFAQPAAAAQETAAGALRTDDPLLHLMLGMLIVLLFVVLFLYRVFHSLRVTIYGESKVAKKAEPVISWAKVSQTLQEAVPIEQEHDIMTDHEYDGIRELDNNLPLWWKYMFYGTIVFSIVYMVWFHMLGGPLQIDEYNKQSAELEKVREEARKKNAANVDETTVALLTESSAISAGQTIYNDNCRACHGGAGEGGVGPNLTDDYWIHGGSLSDIFKTIKYGVTTKGMLAWQDKLKPVEIQQVTSFIKTLHGTNPPNAKEAQGDIYKETAAAADSAAADSANVILKAGVAQ